MKKLLLSIFLILSLAITSFAAEPFFTDVIVTSPNGIWTDARAYSTLNDAVAAVGANERTIVIASPQTVTSLTIPSTVMLKYERNGSISNSGQLTINTKNIIAENRQIFTGTGNVDFAVGTIVKTGWFSNIESAFALTSNDSVTLEISKPATVTANYSPNANVNLRWSSPGNVLSVSAGTTLSNLKNIEAGNFQIIAGPGDIDFVAGAIVKSGWFTNIESAFALTSDDTVTILVTKPQTITGAFSPGNNVNLKWDSPGNILTISSGITVTINGTIQAERFQIFSFADATARILYGIREIHPEWVGNVDSLFYPDYNAADQGDTGNSNTIKYAVDTIGADSGTIFLRHNSGSATTTYTLTTSETIPANINLVIENGAIISRDPGKTLTVYSPANIVARPNQQIFSGTGTTAFSAAGGAVYPDWWATNTTPGTTDMSTALAAAYTAAKVGGLMVLNPTTYLFSTKLQWDGLAEVRGAGVEYTILKKSGNIVGIDIEPYGSSSGVPIGGFFLTSAGGADASDGIQINGVWPLFLHDVFVYSQGANGIVQYGSSVGRFENISCFNNAGDGFVIDGGSGADAGDFTNANTYVNIRTNANGGVGFNIKVGTVTVSSNRIQSLTTENNTGDGLKVAGLTNEVNVYSESNGGVDINITTDSTRCYVISLRATTITNNGTNSYIFSMSPTNALQMPAITGPPVGTNVAGNALDISGGDAGSGAVGRDGGNLNLYGGDAAGTTGAASGGSIRLQGGAPVNGDPYGPIKLQPSGGGVVIGSETAGNTSTSVYFNSTTRAPRFPNMTTAQEAALTGQAGFLVYNTERARFEGYKSSVAAWYSLPFSIEGTPATAGAAGFSGDIKWDANYLYICIDTNTWRRIAHNTW